MSEKRKLKSLPKFKTEKEEADFWATHDTSEYDFKDLDETIELGPELKAKIAARRQERLKRLLKLDEDRFNRLQMIAKQKKVDHLSLLKKWIEEGIEREAV
jgi:hypothetical protein